MATFSKNHNAIVEMSQRLVNGWGLSGTSHDVCHLPLVVDENPSDPLKKFYCSHCRIYLADDKDQTQQMESSSPLIVPSSPAFNEDQHSDNLESVEETHAEPIDLDKDEAAEPKRAPSENESESSYEDLPHTSSLDDVSAKLAEKNAQRLFTAR
ncbi:hypothetical protein GEMRC1_012336 [Eukaryota sp. GEM-RC1]